MSNLRHVTGLSDLQKFLDTLTPRLERNIMRGALRAGMNEVKPAAQAKVRSVSGLLAAGLKVGTTARGGVVKSYLRARGPHSYIGHFVEYGTKPHLISVADAEKPINRRLTAKRGEIVRASMRTINRYVRSLKIATRFVGRTVSHPGARPKAFMRPALDERAQAAVVAVGNYIKGRLTKEGLDAAHVHVEGDE